LRDGNKLESPNAGFPIAALAGALGIGLAGDDCYHGQLKHKRIYFKFHGEPNIKPAWPALFE
jgi:cobalamin biosynthesis protein CobD/CbiB